MTTGIICPCGSGLAARSCHGSQLVRGRRSVDPFRWTIPTPPGLDLARQQTIARSISARRLGVTLHPGLPTMSLEQPLPLGPGDMEFLRDIPLAADNSGRPITSIPASYLWYRQPNRRGATPDVKNLGKGEMDGLVDGYSRTLRPSGHTARDVENISLVAAHFFGQFPLGLVTFVSKPWEAVQRLALYHSLAHWTMHDFPSIVRNLQRAPSETPLLSVLAQTSATPFEMVVKGRFPRGFVIDWVDHTLVFWIGEEIATPRRAFHESIVLSPWRGASDAQFDLHLDTMLFRQLINWMVGATNDLYRFFMDGGRIGNQPEPARAWFYDYLTYLEIVNLVHGILRSTSSFVRLELFMRLAYNLVSRQHPQTGGHIYDLPFSPQSRPMKRTIESSSMPATLKRHLWVQWEELAQRVQDHFVAAIVPAFRPPQSGLNTGYKNLAPTEYVGQFVEALRHSTHGFYPHRGADKSILFTHTGQVPEDLPYLAFFWWLKILISPEWVFGI